MAHHSKEREFKFSGQMLIRWLIFIMVIFLGFNILSSPATTPVLGDSTLSLNEIDIKPALTTVVASLPPQSQEYINNFQNTPMATYLQEKTAYLNQYLDGFPDKQIKEIKKTIVKSIYDDLIKSIDQE